ncbi:MAG: hypothetical protein IJW45_07415 [Oscillospiraceae bacterium]|nr:hypothetical protein [Oscillospiraceae bacterium]
MEYVVIAMVAALTFGACWLIDKGTKKIFRGRVQHASGLSVRLNKRYATIGIVLAFLGVCAIFTGLSGYLALAIGGAVVVLIGGGLIVYYLTFGVFYDDDGFVLSTFGKRSVTYRYDQIRGQILYNASGSILIELHLKDGRGVSLQAGMVGVYPFLDHAFQRWCHQTGRDPAVCAFHDPDNSHWFPDMEG